MNQNPGINIYKMIELIKATQEPADKAVYQEILDTTRPATVTEYINYDSIKIANVEIPTLNLKIDGSWNYITYGGTPDKDNLLISTVHPVFLPLNLTEVNMLTNQLLDLIEESKGQDSNEYKSYKHLVEKIYSQLTPYAKNKIKNPHNLESQEIVRFESEYTLAKKQTGYILNLLYKGNDHIDVLKDGKMVSCNVKFENKKYVLYYNDEKIMEIDPSSLK